MFRECREVMRRQPKKKRLIVNLMIKVIWQEVHEAANSFIEVFALAHLCKKMRFPQPNQYHALHINVITSYFRLF